VVPDLGDAQPPAGQLRGVADGGDPPEQVGDQPGDGLVRALRGLQADPGEGVDPAAAVGVPRGAAVLGGRLGQLGQVDGVVLVADLADQLLDDVLQGDDPGGAAVLSSTTTAMGCWLRSSSSSGCAASVSGTSSGTTAIRLTAVRSRSSAGTARASLRCTMPTMSSSRPR
jgi:hypothetical protein